MLPDNNHEKGAPLDFKDVWAHWTSVFFRPDQTGSFRKVLAEDHGGHAVGIRVLEASVSTPMHS